MTCAHQDCDCMECRDCGVLIDSKSPLIYFGVPANQCWRCFEENCETELEAA